LSNDSGSTDGTLEYVKDQLNQLKVKSYNRPRGLYEAWNFGVSCGTGKYVYFVTAGDLLRPDGLHDRVQCSEQLDADVVVSPPEIIDGSGGKLETEWPIHRFIKDVGVTQPRLLDFRETFFLSLWFGTNGILGSSASNLYRTNVLQRWPFPVDGGHAGDTLWGCRHAHKLKIGLLPATISKFVVEFCGDSSSDLGLQLYWDTTLRFGREGLDALCASGQSNLSEVDRAWAVDTLRHLIHSLENQATRIIESETRSTARLNYTKSLTKVVAERDVLVAELEVVCAERLEALVLIDKARKTAEDEVRTIRASRGGQIMKKLGFLR